MGRTGAMGERSASRGGWFGAAALSDAWGRIRRAGARWAARLPGRRRGLALTIRVGHRSVTGPARSSNQDRLFVDSRRRVFLVADGVGGQLGGEEASRIVSETAPAALLARLEQGVGTPAAMRKALCDAVGEAQAALERFAQDRPEYQRMGSTILLAAVVGDLLYLAHAGDSRAYLIRPHQLRRLTCDHTYVQVLLAAGAISPEEAQRHPLRNVLLQSLGASPEHRRPPEIVVQPLRPDDCLLLATDGLTDVVDEQQMAAIVRWETDPQKAADRLVEQALANDSRDNVSCIVVRVGGEPLEAPEAVPLHAPAPAGP